jgi:pyrimidine operon attenuation protein / uracil phosphoribosyltransferase
MKEREILDSQKIDDIIGKITEEVYSDISKYDKNFDSFAIVGIQTRGVVLGNRIKAGLEEKTGKEIRTGILDITFHRDDLTTRGKLPRIKETRLDFDIEDMIILLVDDVLNTGRTAKAAIETLMTYGRPSAIKYLVLVDRGNRELPIQADYCGQHVETGAGDKVKAFFSESDNVNDSVVLYGE